MFQLTNIALQAHVKQNLTFLGSLRQNPHRIHIRQIYHWAHKFHATGSVNNLNKKSATPRSGRKLTARCPDNVNAVRDSVARSPKKLSFALSVPACVWWSLGTCALIKLSFKPETSNLQFFYCYRICFQEM